ncbi:hypothetical protein GDO86_008814 [Hymenochirus boettgeri]|uniref:Metalloendopeptidase n=1 Tax=Hymenochirus boettgeri TaxID=247094 RepID=A0A8T2J4I5_9PIPI|nr:hypothetical protein GDO86_008814 [Hymenochirus boettgeri]
MGATVFLILLSNLLGLVLNAPVGGLSSKLPAEDTVTGKIEIANRGCKKLLVQGDIAVVPGRSFTDCDGCMWSSSNGIVHVPYTISSAYSQDQINLLTSAMLDFEGLTCVNFIPKTNEANYISILSQDGCWSYVGRILGAQTLSLNKIGCMDYGIIQHELNHALGFYHEHTRNDRDDYVSIQYQYISPGDVSVFDKQESTKHLDLPYDYTSIMHYAANVYSNTSGKNTIIPTPNPNVPIGGGYGLSNLDIAKINKVYSCNNPCSTLMSDPNGIVMSDNYPLFYSNNANCVWLIRTSSGQVSLNFNSFNVQTSTNCISDYIKIYDGATKSSPPILHRTCGTDLPPNVISSTNRMLLEFVSDGSIVETGFKASYTTVKCGGTFYTSSRVNITSPNYPNNYLPSVDCLYLITAPPSFKVSLTMNKFFLERCTASCSCDYLSIYDGSSTSATTLGQNVKNCGAAIFPTLVSTGNSMLLKFHTDQSGQATGFSASYTFVPSS